VSYSSIGSRRPLRLAASNLLLVALLASVLSTTASAASRNFLMALWEGSERADTDFAWFEPTEAQPTRTAILRLDGHYEDTVALQQMLTDANYDWSRIAAVWIDEPYLTAIDPLPGPPPEDPCGHPLSPTTAKMGATRAKVEAAAQMVRNLSAKTRVWVNFSALEVDWIRNDACTFALNDTYIDVISIDYYEGPFDQIEGDYYWLKTHAPTNYQQLGLVPFVGNRTGQNAISPATAASWLFAYYEYAAYHNQTCDLPLGPTGVTGLFDGCRVWAITGWPGVDYSLVYPTQTYVGFYDPTSAPIRDAWRIQREVIRSDQVVSILSPLDLVIHAP
jgi:hypothetical protein